MKKFWVDTLCRFIPNEERRRALRKKLMYSPIDDLHGQIEELRKGVNDIYPKLETFTTKTELSKVESDFRRAITPPAPPTDYDFHGENNKLFVWNKPEIIERLELTMLGDGHKFSLGNFTNKIYDKKIVCLVIFMTMGDCELVIGDNLVVNPLVIIHMCEYGLKCFIGNNVRLAAESKIYVSDAHPIIDIETNKIINYGKRKRVMRIGNNCWIGTGSFIGKSAELPDYTIVAAQSNVIKPFEESYTVIGGNPAHVLKRGVKRIDTWDEAFEMTGENN